MICLRTTWVHKKMEEIIALSIQVIAELVLNVIGPHPFDFPIRKRTDEEPKVIWPANIRWFAIGGGIGWLSTVFIPASLLPVMLLRALNLLVAPFLSGYLSLLIARQRAKSNPFIRPRNHFWRAFWLTAGLATLRFAYAART